jgi:hypothetical protein
MACSLLGCSVVRVGGGSRVHCSSVVVQLVVGCVAMLSRTEMGAEAQKAFPQNSLNCTRTAEIWTAYPGFLQLTAVDCAVPSNPAFFYLLIHPTSLLG